MKRTRLLRIVGLLLAAFAFDGWLASEPAQASCGDYVTVGGHGQGAGHEMPGVPTCHGPSCRKPSPLPASPTKGLMTASPVDAFWSPTDRLIKPPLCGELMEPGLLLSAGHSFPLLRPPCL